MKISCIFGGTFYLDPSLFIKLQDHQRQNDEKKSNMNKIDGAS